MYYLKHRAEEVDQKLDKVPNKWTDIIEEITDTEFNPTSLLAQSGRAIAAELAALEQAIDNKVEENLQELQAISEAELKALFAEIFNND